MPCRGIPRQAAGIMRMPARSGESSRGGPCRAHPWQDCASVIRPRAPSGAAARPGRPQAGAECPDAKARRSRPPAGDPCTPCLAVIFSVASTTPCCARRHFASRLPSLSSDILLDTGRMRGQGPVRAGCTTATGRSKSSAQWAVTVCNGADPSLSRTGPLNF